MAPSERKTSRILAFPVDQVTLTEAVQRCLAFVAAGSPHLVVTPNAEIAYQALHDAELAGVLKQAHLVVPDGVGVVAAARLLGDPVPERVAGVDLAEAILVGVPPATRVYLLGAAEASVKAAACHVVERFPNVTLAGYHHGFWNHFDPTADAAVIRQVRRAAPQVLMVGLGAPRQEKWLARYLTELDVPLAMGVGGALDVWGGTVPRAPEWVRRAHLEWLYRIVRLRRFGRSLPPLIKFGLRVLAHRLVYGRK